MATAFLLSFTDAVLGELLASGGVEIEPDARPVVVEYVSTCLATAGQTGSLVSTMADALLGCPQVIELYIDNDVLKEVITDLPFTALPRGSS